MPDTNLEELAGKITNLIFNREAGWSEKLETLLRTEIERAREEGRQEILVVVNAVNESGKDMNKTLEESARQSEQDRIIKIIDGMRRRQVDWGPLDEEVRGYNQALVELKSKIKEGE